MQRGFAELFVMTPEAAAAVRRACPALDAGGLDGSIMSLLAGSSRIGGGRLSPAGESVGDNVAAAAKVPLAAVLLEDAARGMLDAAPDAPAAALLMMMAGAALGRRDLLALALSTPAAGRAAQGAAQFAAAVGSLDAFDLLAQHADVALVPIAAALVGGHMRIVKTVAAAAAAASPRPFGDVSEADLHRAISLGRTNHIIWLLDNTPFVSCAAAKSLYRLAADAGDLELLKHVHGLGICDARALTSAHQHGHLDVIKWTRANVPEENAVFRINKAAAAGHLDVVQWVHAFVPEDVCTTAAMDGAAANGHLEVVKWLHENRSEGCTHLALDRAAANGHVAVCAWLHANRSEGASAEAVRAAIKAADARTLALLLHPLHSFPLAVYKDGVKSGSLEVVKALHAHDPTARWSAVLTHARKAGRGEIADWIAEQLGSKPEPAKRALDEALEPPTKRSLTSSPKRRGRVSKARAASASA
ncbi:hypothetical protein HK105_201273 [Polyrhizophydium stewartii]|uniref:Ankyrin repeat protein n=1 Tax=Polyrhizophydium stewartii TaxID=2732419 RepID=A0ABR4NHJ6_9FUNG